MFCILHKQKVLFEDRLLIACKIILCIYNLFGVIIPLENGLQDDNKMNTCVCYLQYSSNVKSSNNVLKIENNYHSSNLMQH